MLKDYLIVREDENGQIYVNGEGHTLEDAKEWIEDDKNFNPLPVKYEIYKKVKEQK